MPLPGQYLKYMPFGRGSYTYVRYTEVVNMCIYRILFSLHFFYNPCAIVSLAAYLFVGAYSYVVGLLSGQLGKCLAYLSVFAEGCFL